MRLTTCLVVAIVQISASAATGSCDTHHPLQSRQDLKVFTSTCSTDFGISWRQNDSQPLSHTENPNWFVPGDIEAPPAACAWNCVEDIQNLEHELGKVFSGAQSKCEKLNSIGFNEPKYFSF